MGTTMRMLHANAPRRTLNVAVEMEVERCMRMIGYNPRITTASTSPASFSACAMI
jgi:hypothetical protein